MEPTVNPLVEIHAMLATLDKRLSVLEAGPDLPKRRAKTVEEVALVCAKVGLTDQDAQWFWAKMEGSGWRNNGKPVRNWTMVVTSWKLAHIFPSQKQTNGHSIHSLKAVLIAKEQVLADLRRRYASDTANGRIWNDEAARQKARQLVVEIKQLTQQIANTTTT